VQDTRAFLRKQGLPDTEIGNIPTSTKRFSDGGQYRVEIPSVEGPSVMAQVLSEATQRNVPVHRISQGSGAMLLTDAEIRNMVEQGALAEVDVTLFARPLAGWGIGGGAQYPATSTAAQIRGAEQLVHNIEEVRRMADLGIRGALVTDLGLVDLISTMRRDGELPSDFKLKGSVQMGLSNPASIRLGERLGIDSYNVVSDLTLAELSAIRQAVDLPLDIYIESPDNMGGFVRHYEIAEIVRVAAPVYLKFGLRNSPDIYPSGGHLEQTAIELATERVRRAEIGLAMLERFYPEAKMSQLDLCTQRAVPVRSLEIQDA
jgi:hypothetical protein